MVIETLDPELEINVDATDEFDDLAPPAAPAPYQSRYPWDQPIQTAPCDSCSQPIGLPRLLTVASTLDPTYRARACAPCLNIWRSEGYEGLYTLA